MSRAIPSFAVICSIQADRRSVSYVHGTCIYAFNHK